MNNPYDDEPYSDYDDYDDGHDYDNISNWNKFYFKFDVNPYGSLSDWIKKMMEDLVDFQTPILPEGFSPVSFPVNDLFSHNTVSGGNSLLYLGNNHHNEQIWKKKYFVHNKLETEYVLHLQSHARYFISQPRYYKGLFEILN
jgi:hypothetical protein